MRWRINKRPIDEDCQDHSLVLRLNASLRKALARGLSQETLVGGQKLGVGHGFMV